MTLRVNIRKKFFGSEKHQVVVLRDISFELEPGRILCLYGPSGCGKSTLLRCIAGLDVDFDGDVELDGSPNTHANRSIGMTVQADVSFSWLTVEQNIVFGLRYSTAECDHPWWRRWLGLPDPIRSRADAQRLARLVGLTEEDLGKYPHEISGGMKQRMAFARALLPNPQVLLLDEPFSALEYESRRSLQELVLRVRHQLGTSFVCVSHDPEEVVTLADDVLLLTAVPSTVFGTWAPRWRHTDAHVPGSDRELRLSAEEILAAAQDLREKLIRGSRAHPRRTAMT